MIFHHIFEETYAHQQFNLETCYQHIAPRRTIDEDGHKLLEWSFNLHDLSH